MVTILPFATVKAMTNCGRPCAATTTPAAQLTSAGRTNGERPLEDSEPSWSAPPGEAVAHLQGRERDRYRQLDVDVYAAGDVVRKRRPPRR